MSDKILNTELEKAIKKIILIIENSYVYKNPNLAKNLCQTKSEDSLYELVEDPFLYTLISDDLLCVKLNTWCSAHGKTKHCKKGVSYTCHFLGAVSELVLLLKNTENEERCISSTIKILNVIKKIKDESLLQRAKEFIYGLKHIELTNKITTLFIKSAQILGLILIILSIIVCVYITYRLLNNVHDSIDQQTTHEFKETSAQNYKYPYLEDEFF